MIVRELCLAQDTIYTLSDVASAVLFLLNYKDKFEKTWGNAKCPKFNIVGAEELDNLKLAQIIAQGTR